MMQDLGSRMQDYGLFRIQVVGFRMQDVRCKTEDDVGCRFHEGLIMLDFGCRMQDVSLGCTIVGLGLGCKLRMQATTINTYTTNTNTTNTYHLTLQTLSLHTTNTYTNTTKTTNTKLTHY